MKGVRIWSLGLAVLTAALLAGAADSGVGVVSGSGLAVSSDPESVCAEVQGVRAAPSGVLVSEEEAHRAVWALPEVQARAEALRDQGVRPFTMTLSKPDADSAAYTIYFGEDHGTHTALVAVYSVDAVTGQATVVRE